MNQYLKKVKDKNKYREFIKVLNGLLQLSDREVEVLSLLVKLDAEWPIDFHKNVLSTDSRKYVMSTTKVNKNNLTKYVTKFKSKGILDSTGYNTWGINNMFVPNTEDNKMEIKFILDYND